MKTETHQQDSGLPLSTSNLSAFFLKLANELNAQANIHNRNILIRLTGWSNRENRKAILHSTTTCRAFEQAIRRAILTTEQPTEQ